MASKLEYQIAILCRGLGHFEAGHKVGFVVVKSKSTSPAVLHDAAWKQLDMNGQGMLPSRYHYLFFLGDPVEVKK